jgi:DNA-binding transcriptional LysR family regulator
MTDHVSIEGLRYAWAAAQTHSFTAAARAYGVTQPALSNGIAKLEQQLGGKLFERTTQGAAPTAFGRQLLPMIERALDELDAIAAEAQRLTQPTDRSIHMGVSPLIDPKLVAQMYSMVCDLPESHELVLREADMQELREALSADKLDVILIPAVASMPRFAHRIISREPVAIVTSRAAQGEVSDDVVGGSAAGEVEPRGNMTEFEAEADASFILVPDTCGLTTFTKQLFASHKHPMNAYPGEAASYQVLEQWASMGLGAAILPVSKLSDPKAQHRILQDNGQEVMIAYEAVWNPQSPLARDIEMLAGQITVAEPQYESLTLPTQS